MERILLAADYPNLTELKLFNFNGKIVSHYFTVESPFRRIFQRQITDLILVFENDFNELSVKHYTTDVYGYILKFFENLKHLSIIGSFPHFFPPLVLHFLALLDGRLQQLTTLIVAIGDMAYHSSNVYNMGNSLNLKCFSLTCYCLSYEYDAQILPLFRHMSNLEELTLHITIENRTAFIDGTHIYNEILVHMPRLGTFYFCISTDTHMDRLVRHLSRDDIQGTFTNIIFKQVDCIINYRYRSAICHVFSLPFIFDSLEYIGNKFPTIIFKYVKILAVHDEVPFKHEFFIRIAWSFPLLKQLSVINLNPQ
ncbi:unnamed protein product [Rotaria sordida]|uniref:Uncharacterized protein n=1 Tax=Rotaria sordida TaxID=392033 RepID=A0A815TDH6_9BILA|nr:unnamed protein product [Rotaria sordida]CAF3965275.1 unnamed protein product [Rotaria sordida]